MNSVHTLLDDWVLGGGEDGAILGIPQKPQAQSTFPLPLSWRVLKNHGDEFHILTNNTLVLTSSFKACAMTSSIFIATLWTSLRSWIIAGRKSGTSTLGKFCEGMEKLHVRLCTVSK